MRAHVIENGIVVNTVVVTALDVLPNLVEATSGSIGWKFDGVTFTNPNEKTPEEITAEVAAEVRSDRNLRLKETDWMALSDVVMSPEMTAYRQALRDITAQAGFPHNVIWPVKPT